MPPTMTARQMERLRATERRRRRQVNQWRTRANHESGLAMNADRDAARTQLRRDEHRARNADEAEANALMIVKMWLIALAIPGVMFIDYQMLSAASEYLSMLSGLPQSYARAAQVLFSIFVVVFEISIATRIADSDDESAWRKALQVGMALVFPLALVCLTIAAAHARWEATADPAQQVPLSEAVLLWALAGIGVVVHTLVVMGGRLENEALAYHAYVWTDRSIGGAVRRSKAKYNRHQVRFQNAFQQYGDGLAEHNAAFPETPIAAGPFVDDAYLLADRLFPGYLRRPDAPVPAAGAAAAEPDAPPPAAGADPFAADLNTTADEDVHVPPHAPLAPTRATEIVP